MKPAGPTCVFRTAFLREEVDPRVAAIWPRKPVPFGDLRRTWRLEHCATVNPYGDSGLCPYPASDCALAFLATTQYVVEIGGRNPMGLFRKVARSDGLRRLESKPLARDQVNGAFRSGDGRYRTDRVQPRPSSDDRSGDSEQADLHRPATRPSTAGDVLRSLDFGPRPAWLRQNGEASTE